MNIHSIQSFVILYEQKNMSNASKTLNISQQGLSRQIKALENELDVVLFERSIKGVIPTECGVNLLPHFKNILESYDSINNIVESFRCLKIKTIRIGITHGVLLAIGVDFISECNKIFKDIDIEIVELFDDECYDSLIGNNIDFALMVWPFNESNIIATKIFEAKPYVVVNNNHEYSKTKEILEMKDLHDQPIIALNEKRNLRRLLNNICIEKGIKPRFIVSSLTYRSYETLTDDTVALAIIMEYLIPLSSSANVKILPLVDGPKYNLYFCEKKKQKQNKELKVFNDFIIKYFNYQGKKEHN